jgi:DNA-directed RNA polymerase
MLLAACHEWTMAHELENPEDFVSHLPVAMDGTCNGIQHLSAMGRDPIGAKATNLSTSPKREDIYEQVKAVVSRAINDDAVNGVPEALAWVGRVTRSVVKRAVMTTPYGVTERGIRDQLIADGHVKGADLSVGVTKGAAADYLRDKIVEGLSETVVAAKDIMAWIQKVASELADAGRPMEWTTPCGNVVRQSYYNLAMTNVVTLVGKTRLWSEDENLGLNVRKCTLASAPNLIHSFDAAHVALTCVAFADEMGKHGEPASVAMIHDSYATHAADTAVLARVLREQFVEMYSVNWLENLEQEFRAKNPGVSITPWRDVITMGEFDVAQVQESVFFFS